MYVITVKGKPKTEAQLYKKVYGYEGNYVSDEQVIACKTKKAAIDRFNYHTGCEWHERPNGIEATKVKLEG